MRTLRIVCSRCGKVADVDAYAAIELIVCTVDFDGIHPGLCCDDCTKKGMDEAAASPCRGAVPPAASL